MDCRAAIAAPTVTGVWYFSRTLTRWARNHAARNAPTETAAPAWRPMFGLTLAIWVAATLVASRVSANDANPGPTNSARSVNSGGLLLNPLGLEYRLCNRDRMPAAYLLHRWKHKLIEA